MGGWRKTRFAASLHIKHIRALCGAVWTQSGGNFSPVQNLKSHSASTLCLRDVFLWGDWHKSKSQRPRVWILLTQSCWSLHPILNEKFHKGSFTFVCSFKSSVSPPVRAALQVKEKSKKIKTLTVNWSTTVMAHYSQVWTQKHDSEMSQARWEQSFSFCQTSRKKSVVGNQNKLEGKSKKIRSRRKKPQNI